MDEVVISGTQYIATISHLSSSAFFMMTAISGSTMTPRSFILSTSRQFLALYVETARKIHAIVYGNINGLAN